MAFTLKMYLLKIMSEAICYFLFLRCLHIFCRLVQAVLYQKLQCAAENKRQTILSDLKFTWMHGILLFSVLSALLKTYNPIYTFQIIFHHAFWKRLSKKRTFSEIITISYCQSPMCLLTVENRGVHLALSLACSSGVKFLRTDDWVTHSWEKEPSHNFQHLAPASQSIKGSRVGVGEQGRFTRLSDRSQWVILVPSNSSSPFL